MTGSASFRPLARLVLLAFLLTFVAARALVYAIMARAIPDLFLHLGGTHVHHLNYGIFLLSGVGAWLLLGRPEGRARRVAAMVYGIGLALTFDEFGMWLHLGDSYWQRTSFDAVVVVAAALGLLAYAPAPQAWRPKHWGGALLALLALGVFVFAWSRVLGRAEHSLAPHLDQLERSGPR